MFGRSGPTRVRASMTPAAAVRVHVESPQGDWMDMVVSEDLAWVVVASREFSVVIDPHVFDDLDDLSVVSVLAASTPEAAWGRFFLLPPEDRPASFDRLWRIFAAQARWPVDRGEAAMRIRTKLGVGA